MTVFLTSYRDTKTLTSRSLRKLTIVYSLPFRYKILESVKQSFKCQDQLLLLLCKYFKIWTSIKQRQGINTLTGFSTRPNLIMFPKKICFVVPVHVRPGGRGAWMSIVGERGRKEDSQCSIVLSFIIHQTLMDLFNYKWACHSSPFHSLIL